MKFTCLSALALLASSALAMPGSYQSPNCQADQCLKALRPTRDDCAAFLATTIIPCAATVTKTKTITSTKPKTTVVSKTVSEFPTKTITTSVTTTVTTVVDYVTRLVPSEVLLTSTVVVPLTITDSSQPQKRKAAEICSAKTVCATTLPGCAKACSNNKAHISSACSCLGIGPKTVTAKQPTSTVTVTATAINGPVVTVTKVRTITSTVIQEKTSFVPATLVKTTTTEVPSLYTDFTTISVTSTTTVPAACSGFYIYPYSGGYLAVDGVTGGVAVVYSKMFASNFELRGTTTLYQVGTQLAVGINPTSGDPASLIASSSPGSITPLVFSLDSSNVLTFQSSNGRDKFVVDGSSNQVKYISFSSSVGFGQSLGTLVALPCEGFLTS